MPMKPELPAPGSPGDLPYGVAARIPRDEILNSIAAGCEPDLRHVRAERGDAVTKTKLARRHPTPSG